METNSQAALSSRQFAAMSIPTELRVFPRPVYFAYIPTLLIFSGVLCWIVGGDLGLGIGSVCAAAVALYVLWEWVFFSAPTRFSTLLGMSLLLGYGGGALNTMLSLARGPLTLGQILGLEPGILSQGIAAVLFSSALLFFFGEILEKPIFSAGFKLEIEPAMRQFIYLGTIGILLGYLSHSLAMSGSLAAASGRASVSGMFLSWLYAPLASLAVVAFVTAKQKQTRLWMGLSALVLLLMFTVRGRRVALYTTVEILFALGLAGYQWRKQAFRNIVLMLSLAALIVVGGLVFMLLRIAPTHVAHGTQASLVKRAKAADQLINSGEGLALAAKATRSNAETRTFILSFLANVLNASMNKTPALGRDTLGLLQVSIPSAIDPYKNRFFTEEVFVDQYYGFGYGDQPNSVLTAGAADFGLAGVLIYPLILVLIARVTFEFLSRWLKPIPVFLIAFSLIDLFLQTEATLTVYTTAIRNDAIFGILMQIFFSLPRFQLHSEPREQLR